MARIEIEWLDDTSDCETCGISYAEGASVRVDGVTVIEMTPRAHCFGGDNYYDAVVWLAVLAHFGLAIAVPPGDDVGEAAQSLLRRQGHTVEAERFF